MFVLKLQHFISGILLYFFLSSYLTFFVFLFLFLSLSHTHIHNYLFFKRKNLLMVLFIFDTCISYKIQMLYNRKKFAFYSYLYYFIRIRAERSIKKCLPTERVMKVLIICIYYLKYAFQIKMCLLGCKSRSYLYIYLHIVFIPEMFGSM